MSAISFMRFFAMLLPDLRDLARALYRAYQGDVERARGQLLHIRNHGLRLVAAEADIDERIARARGDKPPPEAS